MSECCSKPSFRWIVEIGGRVGRVEEQVLVGLGHDPIGPVGQLVQHRLAAVDHDVAAEAVAAGIAGHLGRPAAHGVGVGEQALATPTNRLFSMTLFLPPWMWTPISAGRMITFP